jgi:hypothetical protein
MPVAETIIIQGDAIYGKILKNYVLSATANPVSNIEL